MSSPDSFELRKRFARTMPVWPVKEGRCTCDNPKCQRPGKHADPRAPADSPAYAVLAGEGDNPVLVVDVDVKGGVDGFEQLKAWDLPTTFEVWTPSGGLHLYFRHPGGVLKNRKLASAIDVRANPVNDGGHSYVIGPGSPGYEIAEDEPIAECPANLAAFLRIDAEKESGGNVEDISPDHPAWSFIVGLATEDARTYEPSRADGEASSAMMAIVRRLARRYQLPDDAALEVLNAEWNPRCTKSDGVTPYPWDDADLLRALERSRASGPGEGMVDSLWARETGTDVAWKMRLHATPKSLRGAPERLAELKERMAKTREPRGVVAGMTHSGDRRSLTRDELVHALYLSPEWKDVLWYDVLRRRPYARNPPIDAELSLEKGSGLSRTDRALIAHWFSTRGEDVRSELVDEAVYVVTAQRDRQRNAIAEYLDSLEPATDSHVLDTLATDIFGATDPLANTLIKKTLVGAARRGRTPGYPHKGMLVLKGPQGCGKTPAVKILAGEDRYCTTGNGDITSDWTLLACAGNWLVEVEEMSAVKRDVDSLKTAISRTHDTPNVKFEPNPQPYPRSFVFVATTNKESFLQDSSGDARYWVVQVGKIDLARLSELRDRIWAEADFLAQTMPDRWNYLTPEEEAQLSEHQTAYRRVDPFLGPISDWLARTKVRQVDAQYAWEGARLCTSKGSHDTQKSEPSPGEHDRIEACLQILGCAKWTRKDQPARPRIGGRRPSVWWEVPESIGSDTAATEERTSGPGVDQQVVQPN